MVEGESSYGKPIVTVSCAGKQGSYESIYLGSERSGLINCASISFLVDIFHSHGYDADLNPFWGEQLDLKLVKEGDYLFDKRNKNVRLRKTTQSMRKLGNVGKFFHKPNCLRKNTAVVPIRYANRESDVLLKELVHTTFYHGNTIVDGRVDNMSDESDDEILVETSNLVNPDLEKRIRQVAKLESNAILFLTKECKKPSVLKFLHSEKLVDAILAGFKKAHNNLELSETILHSLILLATTFLNELLSDVSSSNGEASPLLNDDNESSSDHNTQSTNHSSISNLHPYLMDRLFSSTLRDESSIVSMRDILRDMGDDNDRQRNILLALMAGSQTRSSRRHGHLSPEQRLLRSLHNENYDEDGRFSEDSRRSSGTSLNLASQKKKSLHQQVFTSKLRRPASKHLPVDEPTKSLIMDGLLLDSKEWVDRALRLGADCKSVDDEGNSILHLAVSMGCQLSIVKSIVDRGAVVGEKELQCCAQTNQKETLEFLLQHTVYKEESITTANCSKEILDCLATAIARQQAQRISMRKDAASFSYKLVAEIISLCLIHYRKGSISICNLLTSALVGDVLLQSIVNNQGPVVKSVYSEQNDIRSPVHSSSEVITKCSLFDVIPVVKFSSMFEADDKLLQNYLLLIESYLWSKQLHDIAVGLTLACKIAECSPHLCVGIERFGFKELAVEHISRAELNLSDFCCPQSIEEVDLSVKCPMSHLAIIHLTKHSQFRCDLCGSGVKQGEHLLYCIFCCVTFQRIFLTDLLNILGRPMHGCRECDWDACEKCTDKSEMGIIKWKFVKEKAQEFLKILATIESSGNDTVIRDNILRIASRIKSKDSTVVEELQDKLKKPGSLSIFEFVSYILPALHTAFYENRNLASTSTDIHGQTNRRKKKKARCLTPNILINDTLGCPRRSEFVKKLMEALVKESILSGFQATNILKRDSDSSDDDEHDRMDLDSAEEKVSSTESRRKLPELVRYIHKALAFYENVRIDCSKSSPNDGMLQTLKLPFAVKLFRMPDLATDAVDGNILRPSRSCGDLLGSIVHVEPLMPLFEFQRHILRCCRVQIPEYIEFCRR